MKKVTTVSDEGFASTNTIRDFSTVIDAGGEEGPDTLEALLAAYASCYVPALRVAAKQRDVGELGRIEIEVSGELNDDDKLESTVFEVSTEEDISPGDAERVVERANELCKVNDALKKSVRAEVSVN